MALHWTLSLAGALTSWLWIGNPRIPPHSVCQRGTQVFTECQLDDRGYGEHEFRSSGSLPFRRQLHNSQTCKCRSRPTLLQSSIRNDAPTASTGRPVENGFIESFNGRLRDECLNVEWFTSLDDAQQKLPKFREHYNQQRPHSALADRTPAAFAALHRGKVSTSMRNPHQSRRTGRSLLGISSFLCDREWERSTSLKSYSALCQNRASVKCAA
jgi:hypothetical protein